MKRVIFSAPWCAQCTSLKETLRVAKVEFEELNIEEDAGSAAATFYGIRGLPTALFFEGENVVKSVVGLKPLSEYL